MGSVGAMKEGSSDRYFQSKNKKFVPEGKPHATGGRVSLSAGGLAGMLGE